MRSSFPRRMVYLTASVALMLMTGAVRADDNGAQKPEDKSGKTAAAETEKADEITPEELAKRLSFEWNQISANASRGLNANAGSTNRSISISGQVKIVKEMDVLALGQQTDLLEAIDETGKDLAPPVAVQPVGPIAQFVARANPFARRGGGGQQRYYQFPNRLPAQAPWFGALNPVGMNVSINLNQEAAPARLTKVKGAIAVLVGKTMPPVDIAAAPSDEWTELSPDLSVRLVKADVQGSSIQYQLECRGDEAIKNFHGWVGPQQALPKALITKAAFVDEFNQEHDISSGNAFNPNTSGSASFGNTGRLMTMRFVVATDVHEVAVPFEIKDLEVPTFGEKPTK